MCDTLGFTGPDRSVFGKNSDRSPNEPQILEYIPAGINTESSLKATYITVPQVKERRGVLLSRPAWMWGAEIGVNDCGVAIGNEAVFTLGKYGDPALTGMDLLRLALERSESAKDAVGIVTNLLEQFGQGGNCGYDHEFHYDNSFLIMDRQELYVLETCGKDWVVKKSDRDAISNRLCVGREGSEYSSAPCNFKRKHTEIVMTTGSGSGKRRKQTLHCLETAETERDVMKALRTHDCGVKNPFAQGSVSSACMHFGGIVGDHTTASMIVSLQDDRTVVWATGTSAPCVSLFKPWLFGTEPVAPVFSAGDDNAKKYWYAAETFRRELLGKKLPEEYYRERDALEDQWLAEAGQTERKSFSVLSAKCRDEETEFFRKWSKCPLEEVPAGKGFTDRWAAKTEVMKKEMNL